MKHLKIFEDYKLANGAEVKTSGVDTNYLMTQGNKMQKFLATHDIDVTGKTFDDIQQAYHHFLRSNPEVQGVWGESAKDEHAWWMKGY